jgi:hypothetical protein
LISFIFGSVTAIAEWKDDAKKDGYDLAAALITTALKALLSAALVILAVAAILCFVMIAVGLAVPVIVVGVIALVISFVAGYAVEAADKSLGRAITGKADNTDGTASVIAPWLRDAGNKISENWNYLISKMPKDYSEIYFAES